MTFADSIDQLGEVGPPLGKRFCHFDAQNGPEIVWPFPKILPFVEPQGETTTPLPPKSNKQDVGNKQFHVLISPTASCEDAPWPQNLGVGDTEWCSPQNQLLALPKWPKMA